MAPQFQVNINISAGADFTQDFIITNPDGTPVDLTGSTIHAALAKHPTAIDARVSTSGSPVYAYHPFISNIVDAITGRYSITMLAKETSKLEEGKYVYNVLLTDVNGDRTSVMSGLAFVDIAFGAMFAEMTAPQAVRTEAAPNYVQNVAPSPTPTPTPTPAPTTRS